LNPARAAAAKRSANGTSLNIIDRLAANRGMAFLLRVGVGFDCAAGRGPRSRQRCYA
jgi:hypothetical protein